MSVGVLPPGKFVDMPLLVDTGVVYALADRKDLMQLMGAGSVVATHIVVGANWSSWSQSQAVEVMIKVSDAFDGTMRWSTRCAASSGDYPSAPAAIEAAARCAVDALVNSRS